MAKQNEAMIWKPGRPGWEIGLIVFVSGLIGVVILWRTFSEDAVGALTVLGLGITWVSIVYDYARTPDAVKTRPPYRITGSLALAGLLITTITVLVDRA